jgi:hypothetical protein
MGGSLMAGLLQIEGLPKMAVVQNRVYPRRVDRATCLHFAQLLRIPVFNGRYLHAVRCHDP